ncbi:NAD(P)-dependent oxidoreductase [Micromonospora endolithica]|uniref:NAD(P)-dependent oxidoreductase n=1 Tax=Micromonospora endolithica TaxID=230091 RepID=UPI001EDF1D86|nr:NAD(P)-binding domain-containing protein [Micromonospora endolithica]
MSVIGLGPMGRALARALLTAGHPVTVWNRTRSRADPLVREGARRGDSVVDTVRASPLTITCVIDYDAVQRTVRPAVDALRGRALVNLTADTPQRAREMARWAAGHRIDYLDGAIMTPAPTIGGPDALVLYSGPEPVWQRHRRTLAALGGTADWLGAEPGRAAAHDVALLDAFWTAMSGIAHAFAVAGAAGVTPGDLAPYARGVVGLLPDLVDDLARRISTDDHVADVSTVRSAAAGMSHVVEASEALGLDAAQLRAALAAARRVIRDGHGDDDFARLTRAYQAEG